MVKKRRRHFLKGFWTSWYENGNKKGQGYYIRQKPEGLHTYGMKMEIKNLRSHLAMENQMDHQLPGTKMATKRKKVKIKNQSIW